MTRKVFHRIGFTLYVLKTALAAGLSWFVASLVSQHQYPYFAALGAILTVQATVADSIHKAVQRVIGIIGGVIISIIVGHWLPLDAASIALVVLLGMAFSTALRLNPQIISQVAVSSLLVALSNIIRHFEQITIQIRGIARALVELGPEAPADPYLVEAMKVTANCIALTAKHEINIHSLEHAHALETAIHKASEHQSSYLTRIKEIESTEELVRLGSILTDLTRILNEITGEGRHVAERDVHLT